MPPKRELIENVQFKIWGYKFVGQIETFSRGGLKSPTLWLLHYNGKRITPFEQELLGIQFPLNSLFKIVYSSALKDLIPEFSKLKVPFATHESAGNLYTIPVVLDSKHGMIYDK